jgi:hypothetical protein
MIIWRLKLRGNSTRYSILQALAIENPTLLALYTWPVVLLDVLGCDKANATAHVVACSDCLFDSSVAPTRTSLPRGLNFHQPPIMGAAKADSSIVSMNEEKNDYGQHAVEKFNDEPGAVAPKYRGTMADQKDMSNMGKKQVLRVCICLNFEYYV